MTNENNGKPALVINTIKFLKFGTAALQNGWHDPSLRRNAGLSELQFMLYSL
jgi:hypothetical protein